MGTGQGRTPSLAVGTTGWSAHLLRKILLACDEPHFLSGTGLQALSMDLEGHWTIDMVRSGATVGWHRRSPWVPP